MGDALVRICRFAYTKPLKLTSIKVTDSREVFPPAGIAQYVI